MTTCASENCICIDCEKEFGTDRINCDISDCIFCSQQEHEEIGYCKRYKEKEGMTN